MFYVMFIVSHLCDYGKFAKKQQSFCSTFHFLVNEAREANYKCQQAPK